MDQINIFARTVYRSVSDSEKRFFSPLEVYEAIKNGTAPLGDYITILEFCEVEE